MSDSSTTDYMLNISCRLSIVVARNFPKDVKFVNLNLELDLKKNTSGIRHLRKILLEEESFSGFLKVGFFILNIKG